MSPLEKRGVLNGTIAQDLHRGSADRKRLATVSLAVGASLSSLMGAYHFFLPGEFHWGAFLRRVPQPIPWALFSINFFFSFLLLAGGVLTFRALAALRRSSHCDRGILIAMGSFWLVNALYQLFIPMPLPIQLGWLHFVLFGFALVAMLAYLTSVLTTRKG